MGSRETSLLDCCELCRQSICSTPEIEFCMLPPVIFSSIKGCPQYIMISREQLLLSIDQVVINHKRRG